MCIIVLSYSCNTENKALADLLDYRLLQAYITSLNILKALLVLEFLILSTNLKLNTLLLCGISLGLTSLKTSFLSNPLISFWRDAAN